MKFKKIYVNTLLNKRTGESVKIGDFLNNEEIIKIITDEDSMGFYLYIKKRL